MTTIAEKEIRCIGREEGIQVTIYPDGALTILDWSTISAISLEPDEVPEFIRTLREMSGK